MLSRPGIHVLWFCGPQATNLTLTDNWIHELSSIRPGGHCIPDIDF